VESLSISGRMTLCNLGIEMGAKSAIVPPDEKTDAFLKGRARAEYTPLISDSSSYDCDLEYDVSELEPLIAAPFRVDNVRPVSDLEGREIDQVFIGTCTNGRLEDLEVAARILKGKKVKARTLVIPAALSRHWSMQAP
jgi:methanogen homoaconitase large subunit